MKDLAVASIFAISSPLQLRWFSLQTQFLEATTHNFDHFIYLQKGDSLLFKGKTRIIPKKVRTTFDPHIHGLRCIMEFFRTHQNYRNFLIIDSDAFPIKLGWQSILLKKMQETNGRSVTVILRPENLESRLHASVLLFRREVINSVAFTKAKFGGPDVLGQQEFDVCIPRLQKSRKNVFVLLRSNRVNVHPLFCGIYYDMFYHHGNGAGGHKEFRGDAYWSMIAKPPWQGDKFANRLFRHPKEFITELAGWNPSQYASLGASSLKLL